jgi:sugar phosphate isomerase/epimerase
VTLLDDSRPTHRIGWSCAADRGDPATLDALLTATIEAGYSHAEIYPTDWDLWPGGQLNNTNVRRLLDVVERYHDRLDFTMHGPSELNLCDAENHELQRDLLAAGIEVARLLHASVMVVHSGQRTQGGPGAAMPMTELLEQERALLEPAADRFAAAGGRLALETWVPTTVADYSYAIWPDQLREQILALGHPNVGACVDLGHVYLSSRWFGFDFLGGLRALADTTNHVHVHDNLGIHDPTAPGMGRSALGRGDLHLPPGLGRIPLQQALEALRPLSDTVLIAELAPRFSYEAARVHALLESATSHATTAHTSTR